MFKRKSKKILSSNLNHNFDTICLHDWIKVAEGDLAYISVNRKFNGQSLDAWYKMQDDYILTFGGDSNEMKQYKTICVEYTNALREWIMNPMLIGKQYTLVNDLYAEKELLQKQIFKKETSEMDYSKLIAKVTIEVKFRIDEKVFSAKEFFNIIKALNDGRASD